MGRKQRHHFSRKAIDPDYVPVQALLSAYPHCYYCKGRLNKHTATRDHLIPKSRGGKNTADNLVLACQKCNCDKGDMTADEYRRRLESRKG